MKSTCTLIAAVVAASTVALSSSSYSTSGDPGFTFIQCVDQGKSKNSRVASEKGKSAPKFDGLRFIETLVTAHR